MKTYFGKDWFIKGLEERPGMAKGPNGKEYKYEEYPMDYEFPKEWEGCFIFARHTGETCRVIYAGEGNLNYEITHRLNFNNGEILKKGADCILIHINADKSERQKEVADLLEACPSLTYQE
jgi:hypothetical protein